MGRQEGVLRGIDIGPPLAWDHLVRRRVRAANGVSVSLSASAFSTREELAMLRFEHILVPVDFEEPSTRALDLAIELATASSATVTIAHIWEFPAYPYMMPIAVDYATPIEEKAKLKLAEVVIAAKSRLSTVDSLLRQGAPWQEILTAINKLHIDLVVMGTHGRRGLNHLLLGSVAEKIVRLSPVPVLTVRGVDG